MKKFSCGIVWMERGAALNEEPKDRDAAKNLLNSLEVRQSESDIDNFPVYVATQAGMGGILGRYKVFVRDEDGTWFRDLEFEKQLLYDIERNHREKLQKERLEAMELSGQIVGHTHEPQFLKGAKAQISIGGKVVGFFDGEIKKAPDTYEYKVQAVEPAVDFTLEPITFTIQLKSTISDEDALRLREEFKEHIASAEAEFRTPITEDDIISLQKAMQADMGVPEQLIGGSPLQIEAFDFPPLEVHKGNTDDEKQLTDEEVDELNRSMGVKK